MPKNLEIKPCIGLSDVVFGCGMKDVEAQLGKPEESELLDDVEESKSTVWHYWKYGFSVFFDEQNHQLFCCIEIDNEDAVLWGEKIFTMNETQIINLFKSKNITQYETELHEWGEKRLSFDDANIDFYFEKDELSSINYGKPLTNLETLILPN